MPARHQLDESCRVALPVHRPCELDARYQTSRIPRPMQLDRRARHCSADRRQRCRAELPHLLARYRGRSALPACRSILPVCDGVAPAAVDRRASIPSASPCRPRRSPTSSRSPRRRPARTASSKMPPTGGIRRCFRGRQRQCRGDGESIIRLGRYRHGDIAGRWRRSSANRDPGTGQCLAPPAASVPLSYAAGLPTLRPSRCSSTPPARFPSRRPPRGCSCGSRTPAAACTARPASRSRPNRRGTR